MIDFVFAMIAAGAGGAGSAGDSSATASAAALAAPQTAEVAPATPSVSIGENTTLGSGVILGGTATAPSSGSSLLDGTSTESQAAAAPAAPAAPASNGFNMAVVPAGLVAEDQTPSGKFTTATEVKPILGATKGNWVAVREYDGADHLYVTHLFSWRCGLHAMAISLNGEPMQNWPLPACHTHFSTPNALLEDDGLPYLRLKLGSVQSIDIQIVYDDLSMDTASFARGDVMIP